MRRIAALLIPAAALTLAACAGAPPAAPPGGAGTVTPAGAPPFATLASRFTARALKQEAAGELRRALDSWKVVAALRTDATEAKGRIAALSARLKTDADQHFRAGTARTREGNSDAARREFLLSLAADPDHAGALDGLRGLLDPDVTFHTVAAGDTFESIAKKKYGGPGWAAVVARINSLDPAGVPAAGAVLTLPNFSLPAGKPVKAAPEPAAGAPEAPDSGYDTEPAVLGGEADAVTVPTAPPPPPTPAGMPKPARRDAPAAADAPDAARRAKAEEFYNAGVSYFINQKLDEAIRSWEQTLELNPDHPKAPKDIEKARGLKKKLKELH